MSYSRYLRLVMGQYLIAGNDIVIPIIKSKPKLCARFGLTMQYTFTPPPHNLGEGKGDTCVYGGPGSNTSMRE